MKMWRLFKRRLSEHFEYSGKLNDDHLQGMMGKAVTKRRGELIAYIKSDGKQPLNIDESIWHRLKKLANSKQRHEKSEQGRYANTCRKTLGRTRASRENSVREKLRTLLWRSLDPDEVEEEMQRYKGYGGQKQKKRIISLERDENMTEVLSSDEDLHSESHEEDSDRLSSDKSNG